jgi:CubicO group peptidase (beta-lactamase class C family)
MNKFISSFVIVLVTTLCLFKTEASSFSPTPTQALRGLDRTIDQAMQDFEVAGLAIGVVVDGEVILSKGYGIKNEYQHPVTDQTLFAIASCSKAFTSFVLGTLVDEGLLEWDRPLIEYMPDLRLWDEYTTYHITARHLLTHLSGLPRHDLMWYNANFSRQEIFERLQYLQPTNELGEKSQYNNLMYILAGYLAERLTGKRWEDLVKERVFNPLNMQDSNFSVDEMQAHLDYAEPFKGYNAIPFRHVSILGPAGSINSNVKDMLQWVNLHLSSGQIETESLISTERLQEMYCPQVSLKKTEDEQYAYGLGWIARTYKGYHTVEHTGRIDGFSSYVGLIPGEKIGIVVLSNGHLNPLPETLGKIIIDRLLDLDGSDWLQIELKKIKKEKVKKEEFRNKPRLVKKFNECRLTVFEGIYEHPAYGLLEIKCNKNRLVALFNGIETPLNYDHEMIFVGSSQCEDPIYEHLSFSFQMTEEGVYSVSIPLEALVDPVVFDRIESF